MRELKTLAKNFINLLYPLHCYGCGRSIDALNEFSLCGDCIASIKENAMPPFELDTPSVMAYSACIYEGTLKELIHLYKYKGKTALAKFFTGLMLDYIKENPEIAAADMITAVPLHKERMREREFNQSVILAKGIAKEYGLVVKDTLKKVSRTKYQNELLKSERLSNLKDAFKVLSPADVAGRSILIIDDVMTTGATLNECALTLLSGGAKSVTCFTLARGI